MVNEEVLKGVPGLKPDEEVVIKKLGYGSLTKLRNKCTDSSMRQDGSIAAKVLFGEYSKWLIIYGIKSATFFNSCRSVDDRSAVIDSDVIEPETGDYLFKKLQEFNKFDKVEALKKE